jgi:integrase
VALYDLYVSQLEHSPGTIKRWRPKYRQFEEFIAPKAWHQATKEDARKWRDELLAPKKYPDRKKVKPITVRDVHFAALKALYAFLEEREWCENPFKDARVRMPKYVEEPRDKDLSEEEARAILQSALEPPSERLSQEYRDAFRWVPWILAYTGARVNEITQLRKQDIHDVEGIWVFHITPEAGRVKTKGFRDVPIHPHLIEMRFLDFVKQHKAGPLFYSSARTRGGKDSKAPYKKVGERLAARVRDIGVSDKGVKPNHGWRHRLVSLLIGLRCRDVEIDAILGHKGPTYGKVSLVLKKAIIDGIPRVELDAAKARAATSSALIEAARKRA